MVGLWLPLDEIWGSRHVTLTPDTLVEPDLAIWDKAILPRAVRGPDLLLVIEVADSFIAWDLRVKSPLYAAHGVREYWMVDAVCETVRVHRAPVEGVYQDVEEYEAHDCIPTLLLPEVTIRLDALD